MENINYSWDNEGPNKLNSEDSIDQIDQSENPQINLSTRKNLQLARRLFHMANGVGIATVYLISLTHQQMIHFLGTLLCLLYIVEQVRINYPETANKLLPITRFIIRAEEQLKESAMLPYTIAVLLTIITFPKPIALVAIYTLAIADPLSAIIGIKFGKNKIVSHKSLEGSAAFFISTFLCSFIVLSGYQGEITGTITFISISIALLSSAFEMVPLKLDDNLTIPLSTAFMLWILCGMFGIIL
jgi:diacylglycerol kinase (CTP)